jgi:hypothetical protein
MTARPPFHHPLSNQTLISDTRGSPNGFPMISNCPGEAIGSRRDNLAAGGRAHGSRISAPWFSGSWRPAPAPRSGCLRPRTSVPGPAIARSGADSDRASGDRRDERDARWPRLDQSADAGGGKAFRRGRAHESSSTPTMSSATASKALNAVSEPGPVSGRLGPAGEGAEMGALAR